MAPLRYATKFDHFLSLDCKGIKFCHLATLAHLQMLRRFASGEDEGMTKEKLKRHLTVVDNILVGAASVLPFWTSSNSTAKDVNLYENTAVSLKSNDQGCYQVLL